MRQFLMPLLLALLISPTLFGQEVPFLQESEYRWLVNEISGDLAYEHIRFFTQFHRPGGGAEGLLTVAEYVEAKAREYGLENVRLIKQPFDRPAWNSKYGEIWQVEPELKLLGSTDQTQLHLLDYSRTTHLKEVQLVSVGAGNTEEDYAGGDVSGKVVLTSGTPSTVMREAVWKRGALGIVAYPDPAEKGGGPRSAGALDRPDQIRWNSIPIKGEGGEVGTFGFQLSARQGLELEQLLSSGAVVKVNIDIEAAFEGEGWQVMVEAFLKGSDFRDQDIVLTGHLQEEKYSANDDASGCASVLEIARVLARGIREGKIERPRRNIRFWWVTEISSERQYFADHPEEARKMLASINQDMVGANQAQDVMRVQNMTQLPFSRFHFLNDVAEAILDFVVKSNTSNLAVTQTTGEPLYPRAIISRLGTRHRYNARVIPFHNSSDHMTFNEAPIGIPAITFTNWPDRYIHSSDDDLWNIDRTQLQRNAFVVAMQACVLGGLGPKTLPRVAAEVQGRAASRMGEDLRLASNWVVSDPERIHDALNQIDQALKREIRAVESLRKVTELPAHEALIDSMIRHLQSAAGAAEASLREQFMALRGEPVPRETLSEPELALQELRPSVIAGPKEFLRRRELKKSVDRLGDLMAFEVLCFVDGRRSGLEIFRAVAAEAVRGGAEYYGTVDAKDVLAYLRNLEDAQLISLSSN